MLPGENVSSIPLTPVSSSARSTVSQKVSRWRPPDTSLLRSSTPRLWVVEGVMSVASLWPSGSPLFEVWGSAVAPNYLVRS